MRLSLYTYIKDALYWDLHAEAMLRHHLPLADEIIVHEGFSTDGTFERISKIDPRIRVFRNRWAEPDGLGWYNVLKDEARRQCSGDWCLHLDCDEFVPEWEFGRLRETLEKTSEDLFSVSVMNFYGNYKVIHSDPAASHWPDRKLVIHRNRPDIEFWGDGSNIRLKDVSFSWPESGSLLAIHHFGFVRHAHRLREKWRNQQAKVYGTGRFTLPAFVFRMFPHRWNDTDFVGYLRRYDGPYIAPVREDPSEFVRDDFYLYRLLSKADVPTSPGGDPTRGSHQP